MNRNQFRRAFVAAKNQVLFGHPSNDEPGNPVFEFASDMLRKYDPLTARLSSFTPDARSRITLYPLNA